MKAFIFSLIMIPAVILSAVFISNKVSSVMDEICELTLDLPEDPASPELGKKLKEIENVWKRNRFIISLSVRRDLVYAMDTCLSNVKSYIKTEQKCDFVQAKGALFVTCDSMRCLEKPGFESIF